MSFNHLKNAFIGNEISYINALGVKVKRIYLDSAASTLALLPAQQATQDFLNFYSNTHSSVHLTAKISTQTIAWAEQSILSFFGANQGYSIAFKGSGATAPLNRLANGIHKLQPDKNTVLISLMEHHSNDLPHRIHNNNVVHIPIHDQAGNFQGINLEAIEQLCQEHQGNLSYIAVTAASNVSGHISPIYDIAEIAHKYGAYIVVDGAQIAAHAPIQLQQDDPNRSIDFFVFSGHKVYTPGSPGVLIAKTELLNKMEPEHYGGGMVSAVSTFDYQVAEESFDKEHAGTINIPGIFSLATTLEFLKQIGMETIFAKEKALTDYLIGKLRELPQINVYCDTPNIKRIGAVSFNAAGIPHQLLSQILNDYFGIAVRNDCFCAHPFVRECLTDELWEIEDEQDVPLYQGMVRASLGLYSDESDIDVLCNALYQITSNKTEYISQYHQTPNHQFEHLTYSVDGSQYFDVNQILDKSFTPFLNARSL